MKQEQLMNIANRLYDLADPWERDDMTPNDFAKVVKDDPLAVIGHLLDIIEDLQA